MEDRGYRPKARGSRRVALRRSLHEVLRSRSLRIAAAATAGLGTIPLGSGVAAAAPPDPIGLPQPYTGPPIVG